MQCARPTCTDEVLHRDLCQHHYLKLWAAGGTRMEPVAPLQAHIRYLHDDCDMSYSAIAAAAHTNTDRLWQIRSGHQETVRNDTYRNILAVQPGQVRDAYISTLGFIRRAQALAAIGWNYRAQASMLGWPTERVSEICRRRNRGSNPRHQWNRIKASDHEAMRNLYDRLCMTKGPDERCITIARKQGFHPVLAWDDEDIDDPAARPYGTYAAQRRTEMKAVRDRNRRLGVASYVDPEPARAHLKALRGLGWLQKDICAAAKISNDTPRNIVKYTRIRRSTAERILALPLQPPKKKAGHDLKAAS